MNKVNIIDIIDRCPRKLSLYVSVLGKEVDNYVIDNDKIEIPVNERLSSLVVYSDGTLFEGGECILFPSSKHRTWKHWQRELFKDGDKITDGDYSKDYHEGEYTWQQLDKFNFKKIIFNPIFKVNDTITSKDNKLKDIRCTYTILEIQNDGYLVESLTGKRIVILFKDQETYTKITPLKPFDKVLVQNLEDKGWMCDFYSKYSKEDNRFIGIGGNTWFYCIPYEGNEGLLK